MRNKINVDQKTAVRNMLNNEHHAPCFEMNKGLQSVLLRVTVGLKHKHIA